MRAVLLLLGLVCLCAGQSRMSPEGAAEMLRLHNVERWVFCSLLLLPWAWISPPTCPPFRRRVVSAWQDDREAGDDEMTKKEEKKKKKKERKAHATLLAAPRWTCPRWCGTSSLCKTPRCGPKGAPATTTTVIWAG